MSHPDLQIPMGHFYFKDFVDNDEELKVKEINSGMYCFEIESLVECLGNLSNNNSQGEYYLTDVIGMLKEKNEKVGALVINHEETLGVNSRVQLAEVESILRRRINNKHLENGITIIDPNTTYIGIDVEIGQDTIIYPGNVLEGNTTIGKNCILYPNSRINNSIIGENVEIQSSVILESKVGNSTTVESLDGPHVHLTATKNGKAINGGAIKISKDSNLEIIESKFIYNILTFFTN